MRKIFVHAGFHKTATTSFQEFCVRNRAELCRQGLQYARLDYRRVPDHPNHSYVFRSAYDAAVAGDGAQREGLLRELGRQLEECDRLLLSGEIVCVLSEPAKRLFLQDLRCLAEELSFVMLVRHPKTYFQSMLQEHLKSWTGPTIYRFAEETLATIIDHDWGSLYTKRLAFFRNQLTRDELVVHKYEDAVLHPHGVIGYLVEEWLGLQLPRTQCAIAPRANIATSHEILLLACALKCLRTDTTNARINRLIDRLTRAAPRNGCRQAFAAPLEHRLPSIAGELAWLDTNFAIRYDLDAVSFEKPDPDGRWSPAFIAELLAFTRRRLDTQDQHQLAAALDFIACRPETRPAHADILTAVSQRLRTAS